MNRTLLILIFLIPFISFSQSQIVNGIDINGPEGFIKNGNLEWVDGDDIIHIQYIEGNDIPFKEYEELCKKGTRSTSFIESTNIEISGNKYPTCLQEGLHGMIVIGTIVNKDGYNYIVTIGVNPLQFKESDRNKKSLEKVYFILGYMITRINVF